MRKVTIGAVVVFFGMMALHAAARAGEDEDKARAVLEKNKLAVVTVQLVTKQKFSMMGMGGEEEESKMEATGTVIGPDGLTVVALSSTDPAAMLSSMMGGMMGDEFKMDSEVADAKILREDGEEVPAKIVLRDKDLDLAFLRPNEKPSEPVSYVDLSDAAAPQILDKLVAVNRLGKVANRVHAAAFERVQAIVEKPRTFYIPGKDPTQSGAGCPAFTLDGKVVGIFVVRSIKTTGGGGGMMAMLGGISDAMQNVAVIVLPAADVLESAQQAPEDAVEEAPEEAIEETPETGSETK